jgi:hypothetical protein
VASLPLPAVESVEAGPPILTGVIARVAGLGARNIILTAYGARFPSSSALLWNGKARETVRVSSQELRAYIPATDVEKPGPVELSVVANGRESSNAIRFESLTANR